MTSEQTASLTVQPVISYPREAEVGKTYLMTVDLQLPAGGYSWPYEDVEEQTVYCMVDAAPLFTCTPLDGPALILHRFGSSYGLLRFLLKAKANTERLKGNIRIMLTNKWGVPLELYQLPSQIVGESKDDPLHGTVAGWTGDKPITVPKHGAILRWDYTLDLAVNRQAELQWFQNWWSGRKRLLKLYGPPGVGKSWFLHQVRESLSPDGNNWFFIDARYAYGATMPAELSGFIENLVGELQKKCSYLPAYDSKIIPAVSLLRQVVEVLCQECAQDKQFLFLVDQCDDLLEDSAWHNFERTILDSLAWMDCTRFVVAMREEQHITIPALRYSYGLLKLSPFNGSIDQEDEHQGDEQLMKLAKNRLGAATTESQAKDWVQSLKTAFPGGYNWHHPTLNLFLFEQHWDLRAPHLQAEPNVSLLQANPDLLREGLTALAPLPADLPNLSTLALIRKLAEQDSWSFSELETISDLSKVAEIWRLQLDPLLEKGFTVVEGSSYRLAEGIYEFVKACI